jgi:hypothetical protein
MKTHDTTRNLLGLPAQVRFAAALALVLAVAAPAAVASAQTCGVLEFGGTGDQLTRNIVVSLSSLVAGELEAVGACDQVQLFDSTDFDEGCGGDTACIKQFAADHWLHYAVGGSVSYDNEVLALQVRLFDSAKGRVIETWQREMTSDPSQMAENVSDFADVAARAIHGDAAADQRTFEDDIFETPEPPPPPPPPPVEEEPEDEPPPSTDLDDMLDNLSADLADDFVPEEEDDDDVIPPREEHVAPDDGLAGGPDKVYVERDPRLALRLTAGFAHYQRSAADGAFGVGVALHRSVWIDAEIAGWFGSVSADVEGADPQYFLMAPISVGVLFKGTGRTVRPMIGVGFSMVGFWKDPDSGKLHVAPGARLTPGLEISLTRSFGLVVHGGIGIYHAADVGRLTTIPDYKVDTVAASIRAGVYLHL